MSTAARWPPGVLAIVLGLFAVSADRSHSATGGHALRPAAPVLFTPMDERAATFTADGRTVYFCTRVADGYLQVLCTSTLRSGKWSEPSVLPFSGSGFDGDPFVTPDGRSLYFASNRDGKGGTRPDLDLWIADRDGDRWSEPRLVPGRVNSPAQEYGPWLARSGKLYFTSTRSGGGDLFVSSPGPDGFAAPDSLGPAIDTAHSEAQATLSPDESTLVFVSVDRPEEELPAGVPYSRGDLYVSRWKDGAWSEARRLPAPINSLAAERSPAFSADGRTLTFTCERGFATSPDVRLTTDVMRRGLASALDGRGNVYAIDARALDAR